MKRLFLGSVAFVALGLGTPAAFAADMRAPAYAPPPPAPPAYTWSGCYIGGGGGYSSGRSTHTAADGATFHNPSLGARNFIPAGTPITDSFNLSGFIGTGELGCNWQWGAWVFGIEGDGSATNKEGQAFETALQAAIPGVSGSGTFISQTQERWLVTARGRLGLTNFWWFGPQTMVYVTGGGAWAKIDTSEFAPGATALTTAHFESNTRSGWTVGGGLEYAVGYGWSVKSEFLYVKFDNFTTFTNAPFAVGTVGPREVKLDDYIWRAALNYKFW